MNLIRHFLVLINSLCFLLFTVQSISADKEVTIAALYWSMNIPGQVAMAKGLEQQIKEINQQSEVKKSPKIKLITRVAGDGVVGIERQIKQMMEVVLLKPAVIIIQPTDNAALAEPLKLANKNQIPVIAYDQYISGGQLTAYISSNNHQAGYLNGEYIASLYPADKKIKLILVEYPLVSSTVERINGFLDALADYNQNYQILKTYHAVEPVAGTKAGKAIIKDFPDKGSIDVIFTVNDGGGLNVVNELAKASRTEIVIATVDGDPASINNIQSQRLTQIDSAQFCGVMGAQAASLAYDVILGKKIPSLVLIPVYPITSKTLANYPGWSGKIPQSFKKPWKAKRSNWNNELKISP